MNLYRCTVPQVSKMLRNLDAWLEEAEAYAEERGFDPDILCGKRLFPDMFGLARQVQAACDNAKFIGARLGGVDSPVHLDEEASLVELRERIRKTLTFLEGLDPAGFEGADERMVAPGFLRGGQLTGADYLHEFALPNFYFHISIAYAIMRQSGVRLGKMKYIGIMNVQTPS